MLRLAFLAVVLLAQAPDPQKIGKPFVPPPGWSELTPKDKHIYLERAILNALNRKPMDYASAIVLYDVAVKVESNFITDNAAMRFKRGHLYFYWGINAKPPILEFVKRSKDDLQKVADDPTAEQWQHNASLILKARRKFLEERGLPD